MRHTGFKQTNNLLIVTKTFISGNFV